MSRASKHPLQPGTTVFPRIWVTNPRRGLHEDIEGRAEIIGPGSAPHHYQVRFEGDAEACERGPLNEDSTRGENV